MKFNAKKENQRQKNKLTMKLIILILTFGCCVLWVCSSKALDDKTSQNVKESGKNAAVGIPGNVLFFHNFGSVSHLHFIRPLADRLAEVGHNVTLVQFAPSKFQHE